MRCALINLNYWMLMLLLCFYKLGPARPTLFPATEGEADSVNPDRAEGEMQVQKLDSGFSGFQF
jgi:hypothetical protein